MQYYSICCLHVGFNTCLVERPCWWLLQQTVWVLLYTARRFRVRHARQHAIENILLVPVRVLREDLRATGWERQ